MDSELLGALSKLADELSMLKREWGTDPKTSTEPPDTRTTVPITHEAVEPPIGDKDTAYGQKQPKEKAKLHVSGHTEPESQQRTDAPYITSPE